MYVPRELEEEVRKYLGGREYIFIEGARQVGKSTLMKELYREIREEKAG